MRLIDADALYAEVTERYRDISAGSYPFNIVAYDMAQLVKKTQTVDVVPVVRCKDCKHFHHSGYCKLIGMEADRFSSDFCSYGERRSNESVV